MTTNPRDRIEDIDARLKELPKGTLTYKTINGKKQPYIQKSVDGKVTSTYVKLDEREQVLLEFEERSRLQEEKKHLLAYMRKLQKILSRNPYLVPGWGLVFRILGITPAENSFMWIRPISFPSGSEAMWRLP